MLEFTLLHTDNKARRGSLKLPHGVVETPVFMPVGTNATVKAVSADILEKIGFKIILANTYHLFLRPGADLIESGGGLHGFSQWKGNFLTDSGGFQVFSLSKLRKINDDGVQFQSHIDGSRHFLTPEKVVKVQTKFNSDIQMQLDVCTGFGTEYKGAVDALRITTQWAKRAKAQWLQSAENGYEGNLFSIVQGNFYKDLRQQSAEFNGELDLPGIAIGGLSVGEPREIYEEMLFYTTELLPREKPRYVMGIGTPEYIFAAVEAGVDMFDCVLPTRNARNGSLFTHDGAISIKREEYTRSFESIDSECTCDVCKKYSRAYMRHLFKSNEILFSMLASEHNLHFLHQMMEKIRKSIVNNEFAEYKKEFFSRYNGGGKGEK